MKLLEVLVEAVEDNMRFTIQSELDSIIGKYDSLGIYSWIYLKGNDAIEVSSIKVKEKSERRKGLGTMLMSEITALCDKYKLLCVLTPEDSESSKTGLLRFYKRFGFESNTGRYKDFRFRNTMIRKPNI
jgi:GNAT superfamily N-acetyltransferase